MKKITAAIAAAALAVSCIGSYTVSAADNYIKDADLIENGNVREAAVELPNGTYTLTADAAVSDINGVYYIYAKTAGHTMASTAIPKSAAAQTVTVPGIVVEDGRCVVGVYANGDAVVKAENFKLTESNDTKTRVPFLKGGEISKLTYVEDNGGKFYRADGTEGDALQILAENGFNLARVRIVNDPGKGHGADGYYLPAGYQDEADCLELCRRAKDKGMQIEFTFAYSDYWVDGDKQMIPHEWAEEIAAKSLTGTKKYEYLEKKVYEYTKDIMQKLVAQGTCPDFVSIGNEMQGGLFFGNAKENGYKHENLYYTDWDWLVRFVNAGARAVRETAPSAKVVIHSDNGGKAILWNDTPFYYLLNNKNVDVDVMAVSYYPFYNADISIDDVVTEFGKCISSFDKDVMIMESGYNFAELRSDGYEGQLQNNGYYQSIYGETPEGQRAYLTELYNKLKAVSGGRCIGVSYWDPVMITDKVGWAISEDGDYTQGNVITNSTIFDFGGKAQPSQLAMKYNTNASDKLLLTGRAEPGAEVALTVNGDKVSVKADRYGDYIAAADYPSDGLLNITAEGKSYTLAAPKDGVLVELAEPYKNELTAADGKATAVFTANNGEDTELMGMLVKYDGNGALSKVQTVKFKPDEQKTASAELPSAAGDTFKSFLWTAGKLQPVADAEKFTVE